MKHQHPQLNEDKVRWPAKKKYPCKKLKGAHEFIIVEEKKVPESVSYIAMKLNNEVLIKIIYYKCSGCGKKDLDFIYK